MIHFSLLGSKVYAESLTTEQGGISHNSTSNRFRRLQLLCELSLAIADMRIAQLRGRLAVVVLFIQFIHPNIYNLFSANFIHIRWLKNNDTGDCEIELDIIRANLKLPVKVFDKLFPDFIVPNNNGLKFNDDEDGFYFY